MNYHARGIVELRNYGKVEIKYSDNGYLREVVYNAVNVEGMGSVTKKLVDVKVLKVIETTAESNTNKIAKLTYLATYADGSFIYRAETNVAVVVDDEAVTTYEGSYVGKTMKWQDQFGKYEVVGKAN